MPSRKILCLLSEFATARLFVWNYLNFIVKKLTVVLCLHPVSRPGGSVSHHSNLTPGQWGSGFMTSGSMTPQGSPASGVSSSQQTGDTDDFGDFSQGPSFPGQGGNDGVFSVFQEAMQPAGQFGGLLLTDRSVIKFNNRLHKLFPHKL